MKPSGIGRGLDHSCPLSLCLSEGCWHQKHSCDSGLARYQSYLFNIMDTPGRISLTFYLQNLAQLVSPGPTLSEQSVASLFSQFLAFVEIIFFFYLSLLHLMSLISKHSALDLLFCSSVDSALQDLNLGESYSPVFIGAAKLSHTWSWAKAVSVFNLLKETGGAHTNGWATCRLPYVALWLTFSLERPSSGFSCLVSVF